MPVSKSVEWMVHRYRNGPALEKVRLCVPDVCVVDDLPVLERHVVTVAAAPRPGDHSAGRDR